MKLPRLVLLLGVLPVAFAQQPSTPAPATPPAPAAAPAPAAKTYKAAIFVSNRAGAAYDSKVGALEDYVSARIADLGVSVISRETSTHAEIGRAHV